MLYQLSYASPLAEVYPIIRYRTAKVLRLRVYCQAKSNNDRQILSTVNAGERCVFSVEKSGFLFFAKAGPIRLIFNNITELLDLVA